MNSASCSAAQRTKPQCRRRSLLGRGGRPRPTSHQGHDDGIEILGATPELTQVMVRCDIKTAERLVQFLNEIAELPERERHEVAVAFREMLLNAIEHGAVSI